MRIANLVSFILLIIGGLNWLVLGLFGNDFVSMITGSQTGIISRIIFILVGLSALWLIFSSIINRSIIFTADNPRRDSSRVE